MTEDFILEEDEGGDSSARRPFLIAVAALAAVGVLAVACTAIILMTRGSRNGTSQEVAAIETQNAIIAVTNEAVTRVIAAMETEAARPTDTPEPTSTDLPTPIPTNTPRPTNTPVVQSAEGDTATPLFSGTSTFGVGLGGSTPTPIGSLGSGGSGDGSLPQTGITTWAATLAALLLLGIVIAARRLRGG